MRRGTSAPVALALALVCLAACARPSGFSQFEDHRRVEVARRFYVERHPVHGYDYAQRIRDELVKFGVEVVVGPPGGQPPDSEVLVRFFDHYWFGDTSVHLASLDLLLYDARTGDLLAAGRAEHDAIWPRPPQTLLHEAVGSIFRYVHFPPES